jgi:hypothetical protein
MLAEEEFDNIKKDIYDMAESTGRRKERAKPQGYIKRNELVKISDIQDKAFDEGHKEGYKIGYEHGHMIGEDEYIKGSVEGFDLGYKAGVDTQKDIQRLKIEEQFKMIEESAEPLKPIIKGDSVRTLSIFVPQRLGLSELPININAEHLTEQELKELLIKVNDAYLFKDKIELDECTMCGECLRDGEE